MGCCTSSVVQTNAAPSRAESVAAAANALSHDVLLQISSTLDSLHEQAEEQQEVQSRAVEEANVFIRRYDLSRPKWENGVALADFGDDSIRNYLCTLSCEQIAEMLTSLGLTSVKTERVAGGFRSQVTSPMHLDQAHMQTWIGSVCTQHQEAEKSASIAALAAKIDMSGFDASESMPTGAGYFIQVCKGDVIEILARDIGGWAFCRGGPKDAVGWLPSDGIAELATVIADHCSLEVDSVLNVRAGQRLEILFRHFCGWSLCREWHDFDHSHASRCQGR